MVEITNNMGQLKLRVIIGRIFEVDSPLLISEGIHIKCPFYEKNHFCPFKKVKKLTSVSRVE